MRRYIYVFICKYIDIYMYVYVCMNLLRISSQSNLTKCNIYFTDVTDIRNLQLIVKNIQNAV